ncbi:hypothetical protein H1S01_06090 [Heliobacterium chlorum]|uniref:Uncharacterized protein n=1 Tax=Heliobacterium chlorum TaxID=2698 RepID=A0ABR7T066_HELCL|nr:hypothetical protein [Heliobacterium chlorum]MBC9784081.1 hypothetical protein [Heliobacterium chlorum]
MPGRIKQIIDKVVQVKGRGNPILIKSTKLKFTLKGIDPEAYTMSSPDDPLLIARVEDIARSFGVPL